MSGNIFKDGGHAMRREKQGNYTRELSSSTKIFFHVTTHIHVRACAGMFDAQSDGQVNKLENKIDGLNRCVIYHQDEFDIATVVLWVGHGVEIVRYHAWYIRRNILWEICQIGAVLFNWTRHLSDVKRLVRCSCR